MTTRKPIKEILSEHKIGVILLIVILTGGTIGIYFVIDYMRAQDPNTITLATTTSTYDSGLLDFIIPEFTDITGIHIRVVSVGTGAAIAAGQLGNADLILVHARSKEDDFINASLGEGGIAYGVNRTCVMYNDFIIVGDESNPAGLEIGDSIVTMMNKLRAGMEDGNTTFYSRGDNSGTNTKELLLWEEISWNPSTVGSTYYTETGAGMGDTLQITYNDADDRGYTLVDRGTWLSYNDTYDTLKKLGSSVTGEDLLLNPYGAILVNPELYPTIKYKAARRFIAFLTCPFGQDLIGSYKKNNVVLFNPAFGICDTTHSCSTTAEEIETWTRYHTEFQNCSL